MWDYILYRSKALCLCCGKTPFPFVSQNTMTAWNYYSTSFITHHLDKWYKIRWWITHRKQCYLSLHASSIHKTNYVLGLNLMGWVNWKLKRDENCACYKTEMFDNILRDLNVNRLPKASFGFVVSELFFLINRQVGERQNIRHDKKQLIFDIQQRSEIII